MRREYCTILHVWRERATAWQVQARPQMQNVQRRRMLNGQASQLCTASKTMAQLAQRRRHRARGICLFSPPTSSVLSIPPFAAGPWPTARRQTDTDTDVSTLLPAVETKTWFTHRGRTRAVRGRTRAVRQRTGVTVQAIDAVPSFCWVSGVDAPGRGALRRGVLGRQGRHTAAAPVWVCTRGLRILHGLALGHRRRGHVDTCSGP